MNARFSKWSDNLSSDGELIDSELAFFLFWADMIKLHFISGYIFDAKEAARYIVSASEFNRRGGALEPDPMIVRLLAEYQLGLVRKRSGRRVPVFSENPTSLDFVDRFFIARDMAMRRKSGEKYEALCAEYSALYGVNCAIVSDAFLRLGVLFKDA